MSEEKNKAVMSTERNLIALRDQFAMAALQGLCSKTEHTLSVDRIANRIPLTAAEAYEYADAMMAEREKNMDASRGPDGADINRGWVNWSGGECPVDDSVMVDVRCADGTMDRGLRASGMVWTHHDTWADIVAYRISWSKP